MVGSDWGKRRKIKVEDWLKIMEYKFYFLNSLMHK